MEPLMRRLGRILLVALTAVSLSGCIFYETRADRHMRETPNFKSGYADGCAAANVEGANFRQSTVRDQALYDSDKAYRAGWASGLSACKPDTPTDPARGPIPDMSPGGH
jgi:hypothetical protein